jgi:hypothetical protein
MGLVKWWKYWEIWRVFIIGIMSMVLSFLSAYFIPTPYGVIGVFIICGIGGILIRKYGPSAIKKFFEIE